jgi:cytoskeletal protein RodZ
MIFQVMTNGFTKRKVGTMTLGEKLKKLRSDKRIALNEISRVTKIRIEYLQCLEDGKYDGLPADVYVRGFLKSYGDFLGVDENSLVKLFEKETGIRKNLEKGKNLGKKKSKTKPLNISVFIFTPKKIVLSLVAILVFGVFFYLYREAGSLSDTPRLIILSPSTNSQIEGKSVFVEGKTDKDARVLINDQAVLVSDEGKFRENITLQSGINIIHIKAVNKFQKEISESITLQAKYEEEKTEFSTGENATENMPDQGVSTSSDKALQIELSVDPGPVWVSVETDGSLVFSGTIIFGVVQKFSANDKIVVNSGQANATYIKLNGEDKGTLGKESGSIKGVVFAKDDKKQ